MGGATGCRVLQERSFIGGCQDKAKKTTEANIDHYIIE